MSQGLIRFITAGSVDDGKSTLIGRMLFDSKVVLADQLLAVSKTKYARVTSSDAAIDLALLTDGLEAEREQGITIDVAYRYFATAKRKFIVADAPGHEQYTRNLVTGASQSDVAVILIDATRVDLTTSPPTLLDQTKRHSAIVKLLGIRHLIFAINKMDLIGFDEVTFRLSPCKVRRN
jgi:sulfate adenylyltransferase subunit 1